MCGIVGFSQPQATMNLTEGRILTQRMCGTIAHRGPDDEGIYVNDAVALGMRRLAIIDLNTGHQPITNEDGSVWLVFNGEIYNFAELRADLIARGHRFATNTDTETIVHLYEEMGERCVERLRGMFAFALWDARARKLLLVRDRVGVKPLHYTVVGETLIFGSEIKAILQHPLVKREVNVTAISDYLSFGYVPDPATAFRGIYKLPPGHTLTWQAGEIQLRRYWDFSYGGASQPELDEQECVERLRAVLTEAVQLRLVSDVPLGAFLSGGIDSSTVVALMTGLLQQPVKTFSIGFNEAEFDELEYARRTAQHFGTEHHEFVVTPDLCQLVHEIVWHHDEPFADVSSIPTYVVSKLARSFVTVALSGDGGDELFAGYERYAIDRARQPFNHLPTLLRRGVLLPLSRALPHAAYGKNYLRNIALDADARFVDSLAFFDEESKRSLLTDQAKRAVNGHDSTALFRAHYAAPQTAEHLERLLYLDSKTYLPADVMTKVDRMSMAHGLEAREPLLDHKLIEFVGALPASLKLRGLTTKYLLKKAMTGSVPDEIIKRPKRGFAVPIKHWLKQELHELLLDTLTGQRSRERGYFDQQAVLALIDEHQRGRRDNALPLWGLLMLELWQRAFIDQQPEASFVGAKELEIRQLAVSAASGGRR